MNPTNINLALQALLLMSTSIEERLNKQTELIALFKKATEEGRDFTEEEVASFERAAEASLHKLDLLIRDLE